MRTTALLFFALGTVASGPAMRPAHAATLTTSLGVSATVQTGCVSTAPATVFGSFARTVLDPNSFVSVVCTQSTPYKVGVNAESMPDSGPVTWWRWMSDGGFTRQCCELMPNLRAVVNARPAAATVEANGSGYETAKTLPLKDGVVNGMDFASNGYTDTITITITY